MKKVVLAGASSRGYGMFAKPLSENYSGRVEICGIHDINHERARLFAGDIGGFRAYEDFDEMLSETRPDIVIVTTVDAYHHEYVIKAL